MEISLKLCVFFNNIMFFVGKRLMEISLEEVFYT